LETKVGISEKSIKLLWGRSGNRCALCKAELSHDSETANKSFPLGEQAHIIGETNGSPRGQSILSSDEREQYHNRILLCPTDHTIIDKNVDDWPVEKLHMKKTEHELWVQQTLSSTLDAKTVATQAIFAHIVDQAVDKCKLAEWSQWSSFASSADPKWPVELPDLIFEFRGVVIAAVWPEGYDEFKRAVDTLSILMHKAAQTFVEHCRLVDHMLVSDKIYSNFGRYNPNYEEDLQEYKRYIQRCYDSLEDAARAANWFADVVRRDLNPSFFAIHGKFLITDGPYPDLTFKTRRLEFTENEKQKLPEGLE
jgi:hypothetical protein